MKGHEVSHGPAFQHVNTRLHVGEAVGAKGKGSSVVSKELHKAVNNVFRHIVNKNYEQNSKNRTLWSAATDGKCFGEAVVNTDTLSPPGEVRAK